tara:strand:+ start:76338 stop:77453 length:1116 start_codon:yes stop_codon:yes gene_type:complete
MENRMEEIEPIKVKFEEGIVLECGKKLDEFELIYETYGSLNEEKSNSILICHALSGNHHAAGEYNEEGKLKRGWWDEVIGPGKAIDTDKFFVVCPNNLGGCHGSTGPTSTNPKNGELFGSDFPIVTVNDWVQTQHMLMKHLGLNRWHAVIGGSLGGMQALQWAQIYPTEVLKAGVIAATPKLSAQNIAFNEVARQAIISDPDFQEGDYLKKESAPKKGLRLARMVGHITYLSDEAMKNKFGRELKEGKLNFGFDAEFQVESYLRYQGDQFSESFDAHTYLLMTKVLDYFDPAQEFSGNLVKAFERVQAKILVISFSSDWRFSPNRSKEIVNALLEARKDTTYLEIESPHGHDSFLFSVPRYKNALRAFLRN